MIAAGVQIFGSYLSQKRVLGPKGVFKNRTSAHRDGDDGFIAEGPGGVMFAYGQPNPDAVIVSCVFEMA